MSELLQPWADRARAAALPGAGISWLAGTRQQALERFMTEGWPTTRHPDWRHTSLAFLQRQSFDGAPATTSRYDLAALQQGQSGHWLVFVDGRFAPALSRVQDLPSGVQLDSLARILQDAPEQAQALLGQATEDGSTAALNLALAGDGVWLHVSKGIELEVPINVVYLTEQDRVASFVRNVVLLEAGARATLIEHHVGTAQDHTFSSIVLRARLESAAELVHLKVQQEHHKAFHLATVNIDQQADSRYESHSISFGALLARNDIVTRFNGTGCDTLLNGLFFADGRRHVDHNTCIDHAQPDSTSHEYYRGILTDAAQGVFTGRIKVSPGADGTDAIQRSDNLLLARTARIATQPQLEIYAEDVKCAHGATVGEIDEDSLFYLRSRGLSERHARAIMIYAFAAQALQRIRLESMRQRMTDTVLALLPDGELVGAIA